MPRLALSPTGGYYADPNRHWSAQDCVNWLPMKAERPGTRTPDQLRQCPGLRPFAPNMGGATRGLHNVEGKLFGVGGNTLYRIKPTVVIPYGTVPGTARVSMAHNAANELLTVNGSAGYLLNTSSLVLSKITDEGYPGASVVAFVDQYFPQVAPNGAFWFWSDLSNGSAYNTLDRAEAEADPDRIVTLFVSHREVLVFGRDTIEPFINTGAATGTFQRAANTVIECGCAARFSVAGMDNAVFFLDDKRVVRVLRGVTPERVSNAGIEQALGECTAEEISRAFAFTWEDRGHKVYYLTVPGRFTFGFDLLSGEWHRRVSPGMNTWRITSLVFWEGQWIGGDAEGKLYALDWDYHYDGREELIRERVTGVLAADQRPVTVNEAELLFSVGGPTSELDDWPDQPASPTISGDAPDGFTGEAYTYTYTTGAGTAPLRVSLHTGTLPPGLTLSTAGVLSGAPTTAGSYEWTVRVYDANGLWAEVEDESVVGEGAWMVGQVALNGASGGSEIYYLRAPTPATLLTATPRALPAQGSGALERLSTANGQCFMHRATLACVSADRGATWTACDAPLEIDRDVWWNGTKYYNGGLCSADRLAWTAIPNLPATAKVQLARASDGLIVVQASDGTVHVSTDDGANWTNKGAFGASYTERPDTDGDRIVQAAASGLLYKTDNEYTAVTEVGDGYTFSHSTYYANSVWLQFQHINAGVEGTGLRRSTDGETWPEPVDEDAFVLFVDGQDFDIRQLATDGAGTWAAWIATGGTPNERLLYVTADDGETWALAGTLYGDANGLTYAAEAA